MYILIDATVCGGPVDVMSTEVVRYSPCHASTGFCCAGTAPK